MYIHGIYMFTIVCTGINMYIHGIDLYIPLCQILSIWSGFQMFVLGVRREAQGFIVAQSRGRPVPKFIEIVYFVKSADKSIRIGAAPVVLLYLLLLPPQLLNFRIVLRSITLFWPWLGDGIESNLIEMKAVVVRC